MQDRNRKGRDLQELADRLLPGSNTGNMAFDPEHRLILREGKGSRVWDVNGKEYIDYLMGSGPIVLGHAHPAVVAAVIEAVERGSTFFSTNENAVLLAEEITKAVPCADRVRFSTSGTDAVFQCLRAARSFRKRDKIMKFEGAYHGSSDYAVMSLVPGPGDLKPFPEPVPSYPGIPEVLKETMLVAPYNDAETTIAIIEKHHDEIAGLVVEPMQRTLPPLPGFLQALRDVTAHYQIPLIFDEVVTGFRLAYGGAQEYYGVTPDMAAMGKIVGGGFPLAVITGREEIMSIYDQDAADPENYVPQIGTLNGSPVACAAGLSTLAELRKEGVYQQLHATGRRLREALQRLFREAEIPTQPAGEDPMFGFFFAEEPITDYRGTLKADTATMGRFNRLLLDQGILKNWPDKFYPSLAHSSEDVDRTIEVFASAIDRLRE